MSEELFDLIIDIHKQRAKAASACCGISLTNGKHAEEEILKLLDLVRKYIKEQNV